MRSRAVALLTIGAALAPMPALAAAKQRLSMADARSAARGAAHIDLFKTFSYPKSETAPTCSRVTRLRAKCRYTIADDKTICRREVLVIKRDGPAGPDPRHPLKTRITNLGCSPT